MTPEEFRRHGHEVVDWIADYWSRIGSFPVRSPVAPGRGARRAARRRRPSRASRSPPSSPTSTGRRCPGSRTGSTPASSPTSRPTPPARRCSATWSAPASACRACSGPPARPHRDRDTSCDWLADLLDLPAAFRSTATGGGVIQDSAPAPTWSPCSPRCTGPAAGATVRHGVDPERSTVYVSTEAHSSIEKAARIAGLGSDAVRLVDVDGDLAMRPDALRRPAGARRRPRLRPVLVCATVGTTSTTAVDPLAEIGAICRRVRRLAARRRRLRRRGARLPRAARPARRRGVGRLVLLRPAQVAADRLRLRRASGSPTGPS